MSDEFRDEWMISETKMCEQLDSKSETKDNQNNMKRYNRFRHQLMTFIFENRIESTVFAKDSMDRFGNDLTELILSFFTIEDTLRLECVSKQWKRYIFGKHFWLIVLSST